MAQGSPELIGALRAIDPTKPYGTPLFDALAQLTVSPAAEAVCFRLGHGTDEGVLVDTGGDKLLHVPSRHFSFTEVYLVQRAPDDTAYPGEWHCPGSVVRPGENFGDVFNRLAKREFGGKISSYRFICLANHPSEARGHFLSLVYLCVLEDAEGLRGKWFPVSELPQNTVETHRVRIIPAALGAFVAEHPEICE